MPPSWTPSWTTSSPNAKMLHRGRVDSRHRQRRHVGRRRGDGATPEQVSDWWSRLAEGERQRHVDRFTKPEAPNDESVREQTRKFVSLDGIEGWARYNVNRSLLEWDIEDTKRQRDALPGNKGPGEEYTAEGQARNHERARLRERLEELEKLRGQLGAEGGQASQTAAPLRSGNGAAAKPTTCRKATPTPCATEPIL